LSHCRRQGSSLSFSDAAGTVPTPPPGTILVYRKRVKPFFPCACESVRATRDLSLRNDAVGLSTDAAALRLQGRRASRPPTPDFHPEFHATEVVRLRGVRGCYRDRTEVARLPLQHTRGHSEFHVAEVVRLRGVRRGHRDRTEVSRLPLQHTGSHHKFHGPEVVRLRGVRRGRRNRTTNRKPPRVTTGEPNGRASSLAVKAYGTNIHKHSLGGL
jgi:hypothetical protein